MTSNILLAHTIYAPSDIPLLDNRFRIDPFTEQVTFVLNHTESPQLIVLVRPDGSKLNYMEHPKSVAWTTTSNLDIITIDKPMTGPWQALAELNGNNRIKLISNVKLTTNKLPLKLYAKEYITTHASLYADNKLMTDKDYLDGAKLSVSLIGKKEKQLTLYKDNGKSYDTLPFDGMLTAHVYIDLTPGRYLLSVRTKNDIFIRNQNKDAVVFPSPIISLPAAIEYGSKNVTFSFKVDNEEIDPKSISIDGIIRNDKNKVIGQVIIHSTDNVSADGVFTKTQEIDYGNFTFSAKAFATTRSGREIELQLPSETFELIAKIEMPSITSHVETAEEAEQAEPTPIWKNTWVLIGVATILVFLILTVVFIFIRRRKKNKKIDNENKLSLDELQPEPIDLNSSKK